ncbi:undecaprenyl-diphosphate phosphatase [Cellulosimicrobium cellulans]|uniref:Undecaprenyl-diphosphatase n=1 Tax=Cellulosimicrobium funkei TaxID=264251 RepID=A0A4Y8R6L4_9MICO|nr:MULTISPECIES: undecaprenyl-diphosphate phosphatase [Cellulosimicrobium]NMF29050.1 undecaprenyl-diphosphate phosphatase [Cellulosimicrobium aquatile]TGA78634.1 undecaprenyl-diphosphate phosphatase [Cellulosimicrobium terreum]MCM3533075.1 undecaprenyl-diphosphate phosphatase [Cellulosimicrobium funkei]MDQ8042215.1 undecaprenyl-diphosphate phosphatase [Cellulosimicrobium sp. XJ-DQ-B-000]TFF16536.1 undecaprenyl-diphosphate phosphatase [Cellulosimicrobium funkei]
MNAWEAVLLGLVQGLTEFLPISSSAHLRIVGELIGSQDPGAAFTAITQIGTETAVLLYFRRDIARICSAWWRSVRGDHGTDWRARLGRHDHDAAMAWYIALGSVPIVLLGLLFQDAIENTFRNLYLTALMLAVFALLLGWADRIGAKRRTLRELSAGQAVAFGFAQALALVPGVSRSGGTITAGLLMGFTREAAARYSFLLAIPAVMGSGFYQLFKSADEPAPGAPGAGATLIATLVAFVVGYFVIIAFLKIVSTFSYTPFVVYRLVLAALVVLLLLVGVLEPGGTAVSTP